MRSKKMKAEECLKLLTGYLKERSAHLEELIDYYERIDEVRGYLTTDEKLAYFKALDQFDELGSLVGFLVTILEPEKKVSFLGNKSKDNGKEKEKNEQYVI